MHTTNARLFALLTAALASCGAPSRTDVSGEGGAENAHASDASGSTDAPSDQGVADALLDSSAGDASIFDAGSGDACAPGYGTDGDGGCVPLTIRRPFLVGASMRASHAVNRSDWARAIRTTPHELAPETAAYLAEAWRRDGLEEHASIAAFARFTLLMMSVGAPPDLLAASQRASLDEIRHAELCFALAARYGGTDIGPSPMPVHDAIGPLSLAEIAALTAEEGCLGETLGASLAAEQLARATDPAAVSALRRIARDEMRHAELAWKFVAWAIARGGAPVCDAVTDALHRAIESTRRMPIRAYPGLDAKAWRAHGRTTCAEARAIAERTWGDVIAPCAARLDRIRSASPDRRNIAC